MTAGPFSGKVIDELRGRVSDVLRAIGDANLEGKDAKLNPMRVAREARQAGITDLDFWEKLAFVLVEIACIVVDSIPDGGGASIKEIEVLKMFIVKDIDNMLANVNSMDEKETD